MDINKCDKCELGFYINENYECQENEPSKNLLPMVVLFLITFGGIGIFLFYKRILSVS